MNILVLGGTQFSGRAFVELAISQNHQITLLHRSKEDPGLPSQVRRLVGDRDPEKGDGLKLIQDLIDQGQRFDAVLDMCGYTPRVTKAACELLKDHTDLYIFVSTISVYDQSNGPVVLDEDAPKITLDDPSVEEVNGETYGGLKVLCEQVVIDTFPESHCIPRPCVIAGPNDPTDRVTWWPRMLTTQESLVIPDVPNALASFVDSRDLAEFFLHCASNKVTGIMNTTGPQPELKLSEFIERAHTALNSSTKLYKASSDWFESQKIQPWVDIPTWLPNESQFMHQVVSDKARSLGFKNRALEETVQAIAQWDEERGHPDLKAGMNTDRLQTAVDSYSSSHTSTTE